MEEDQRQQVEVYGLNLRDTIQLPRSNNNSVNILIVFLGGIVDICDELDLWIQGRIVGRMCPVSVYSLSRLGLHSTGKASQREQIFRDEQVLYVREWCELQTRHWNGGTKSVVPLMALAEVLAFSS